MDTLSLKKENRLYNEEETICLASGAGKIRKATCKSMKLEHFPSPYTHTHIHTQKKKKTHKWIKDLDVRPETVKLLDENIGKTISDINHSRILYDPPPIVMAIKVKINKWDVIKSKSEQQRKI